MGTPRNAPSFSSQEKPTHDPNRDVRLEVLDDPLGKKEEEADNPKIALDDDEENARLLPGRVEDPKNGPKLEEGLAEVEVNSLIWLYNGKNEKLKVAYELWQAKDVLFTSRVERKLKQSDALRNEIYQLVGFFSVFQGVLLTAVSQSNLLVCHNWWSAFSLSLLASLVTVGGVLQKFLLVLELEQTINDEVLSRRICIDRSRKLLQEREKFDLRNLQDSRRRVPNQRKLRLSIVVVVFILLVFSALFLASIIRILCHSGIPASPTTR